LSQRQEYILVFGTVRQGSEKLGCSIVILRFEDGASKSVYLTESVSVRKLFPKAECFPITIQLF
tara:strand:+ start:292 stop:483 length:192 start_codon:yes stop_codon:yes gene_type:complete